MTVRSIEEIEGTDRDVHCPNGGFRSLRIVLAKDGMGFSVHKTIIPVGNPQHWHYTRHFETCYCIEGRGILTNLTTGETFEIKPDTAYSLDNHDDHTFQAIEPIVLISIFNPPVTGMEVHQSDGSYSAAE